MNLPLNLQLPQSKNSTTFITRTIKEPSIYYPIVVVKEPSVNFSVTMVQEQSIEFSATISQELLADPLTSIV